MVYSIFSTLTGWFLGYSDSILNNQYQCKHTDDFRVHFQNKIKSFHNEILVLQFSYKKQESNVNPAFKKQTNKQTKKNWI